MTVNRTVFDTLFDVWLIVFGVVVVLSFAAIVIWREVARRAAKRAAQPAARRIEPDTRRAVYYWEKQALVACLHVGDMYAEGDRVARAAAVRALAALLEGIPVACHWQVRFAMSLYTDMDRVTELWDQAQPATEAGTSVEQPGAAADAEAAAARESADQGGEPSEPARDTIEEGEELRHGPKSGVAPCAYPGFHLQTSSQWLEPRNCASCGRAYLCAQCMPGDEACEGCGRAYCMDCGSGAWVELCATCFTRLHSALGAEEFDALTEGCGSDETKLGKALRREIYQRYLRGNAAETMEAS